MRSGHRVVCRDRRAGHESDYGRGHRHGLEIFLDDGRLSSGYEVGVAEGLSYQVGCPRERPPVGCPPGGHSFQMSLSDICQHSSWSSGNRAVGIAVVKPGSNAETVRMNWQAFNGTALNLLMAASRIGDINPTAESVLPETKQGNHVGLCRTELSA